MFKKIALILIGTLCIQHGILNAGPNTLIKCHSDGECEALGLKRGLCPKQPGYGTPSYKCVKKEIYGRPVSYCVCEYTSDDRSVRDKFVTGMEQQFLHCSYKDGEVAGCENAACSSGANPICDATKDGICYCPW